MSSRYARTVATPPPRRRASAAAPTPRRRRRRRPRSARTPASTQPRRRTRTAPRRRWRAPPPALLARCAQTQRPGAPPHRHPSQRLWRCTSLHAGRSAMLCLRCALILPLRQPWERSGAATGENASARRGGGPWTLARATSLRGRARPDAVAGGRLGSRRCMTSAALSLVRSLRLPLIAPFMTSADASLLASVPHHPASQPRAAR